MKILNLNVMHFLQNQSHYFSNAPLNIHESGADSISSVAPVSARFKQSSTNTQRGSPAPAHSIPSLESVFCNCPVLYARAALLRLACRVASRRHIEATKVIPTRKRLSLSSFRMIQILFQLIQHKNVSRSQL